MDKRFNTVSISEQLQLRKQAIDDILTHPEWELRQSIRYLKTTLRLTSAELAKLAGISHRALQDLEQGRSQGTVKTLNSILGVLGLRLGVVRSEKVGAGETALVIPPTAVGNAARTSTR